MSNLGNPYSVVHAGRSVSFQFDDPADHIPKRIVGSKTFYEIDVLDEISSIGVGEGLFIDVGANIGNHTLYFSGILNRKVIAFEPVESAYAQLLRNVRLNRVENLVTCHRLALGAECGTGEMRVVEGNLGASRFIPGDEGGVAMETLDTVLQDVKEPVALIKIDVEGLEVEVLRGAVNTIARSAPVLIVEGQNSVAFGNIRDVLAEIDYVPVSIRGATPTYFFVHRSKLGSVQDGSLFYMKSDIDHNRRVLQSYVARIESNLRDTSAKADAINDRALTLASGIEKIAERIDLDRAGRDDNSSRQLTLLERHENSIQAMVNTVNGALLSFDTALSKLADTMAQEVTEQLAKDRSHQIAVLGQQETAIQAVAAAVGEEARSLGMKLAGLTDSMARTQDVVERLTEDGTEQRAMFGEIGRSLQAVADSLGKELKSLEAGVSGLAESLPLDVAGLLADGATRQLALLERQESAIRTVSNAIRDNVNALEAKIAELAQSLPLDVAGLITEDGALQRAALQRQEERICAIADSIHQNARGFESKFSELSDSLPSNVAALLASDAASQLASLGRQEESIQALGHSVNGGIKAVEVEVNRLGKLVAMQVNNGAKEAVPPLLRQMQTLEANISARIFSRADTIQAGLKSLNAARAENDKMLARKDGQIEAAQAESERLQAEINRLLVAVQTERVRARYVSRRLNTLYTTGPRAVFGKLKKIASSLTFGLVKPYENWPSFEKRLERRVVREVQDFKKLHANIFDRPAFKGNDTDEPARAGYVDVRIPHADISPKSAPAGKIPQRERVRIGIASIEIRRTALSHVIDCLYDQADEILVYLNDYSEIPSFLNREKIRAIHGKGDVGDRGKFYDIDNFSGYFFTCDDDIIYPPYYVQHCIDAIERYGRKAVVGWHGSVFKKPFVDYYSAESRRVFSFRSGRPEDIAVHVLGTGCSSFHTETIKVQYSDFLTPNMADVYFALLGQKQKVPYVVVKHDPSEAVPLEIPDDKPIHRESMQKTGSRADTREIQNRCVKEWEDWRAELPPLAHSRASYTIAYVGRVDAERWKKGGILKSGGLITQALRSLGHRILDIEISQPLEALSQQIKPADIVWIYPGDPERPDFEPVEALIGQAAKAGKQVYVNLSYNLIESRTQWIKAKMGAWKKVYGGKVKACLFTYAAMSEPEFAGVRENLICIPKSIDFSDDIRAGFDSTEGIFLGDLQKLLNRGLVNGAIEDWIAALRKVLPDVTLYAVRQYGGKIDRELGLTVLPYTKGRAWEEWLAAKRIVCCLTPHATYEMIPIEAGGLGVPCIYRPMPQSHSENISTSGIQVSTPEEFAAACAAIYHDYTLWQMYSQAGIAKAESARINHVAASLHMQLMLGKLP